jgi:galactitol-specific phosphotransferase system IIB component
MALATVSAFASFDQTANVNKLDISPFLSEALIYDFHLLGHVGMPMDNPITDVTYYWLEDSLNSDSLTLTISLGTTDTSITYSASTAPHVGDYVTVQGVTNNNKEIMQITTVNSTTNATVSRGFAATTAASVATTSTLVLQRLEQEMSDIGTDATVNPTVRQSYTSIIPGRDLQISGSQLARDMAASVMQDQVAHQLANRLKEWKRSVTRSLIYSRSFGPRSDTAYSSFGGIADWITNGSGQTYTTANTLALTQLDSQNKLIVDLGDEGPDTLLVGTDLVGSINAINATNRQLLESDKQVGHIVTRVLLGQGNAVDVVVDARVQQGHAFMFQKEKVRMRPLQGRALFTLAGSDWVDGVKRRILGEWGCEIRQPSTFSWLSNQS